MSELQVRDLEVRYGPIAAVRSAAFECGFGEIVTIVGPNGAGKSSVLNALAGASEGAVEGTAYFDGLSLRDAMPEAIVRHGLSLVPEGRRIFMGLTVRDNLSLGATARGTRAERELAVAEVLDEFSSLADRLEQTAGTLSGGEQQQLAIARALASKPRLLMLDEPSLGLAPMMVDQVFATIASLRAKAIGIVLVEQHASRAMELADRCYVMQNGELAPAARDSQGQGMLDAYLGTLPRAHD